ncbi:MAG: glycosyltransferase, partial [Rickettsiales bacterium]
MVNNILAVIVLYNTPLQNSKTFQSILKALKEPGEKLDILIYDNSFSSQIIDRSILTSNINLSYHHDKSNSGLSKAYNYAATIAEKDHKNWLLFLDQDTTFTSDIFDQYYSAVQNYPTIKLFVPILKLNTQQIGSLIKQSRIKKGYTQQQVADMTQLSLRSVQRIEKGEVMPRRYSLEVLANQLEFTPITFEDELTESKSQA